MQNAPFTSPRFATRIKYSLTLLILLIAQSVSADDRSYIEGQWRYTASWDTGTTNGQTSDHSSAQSALDAALAAIDSDPWTCSATVITSTGTFNNQYPTAGLPTYGVRYDNGERGKYNSTYSGMGTTCNSGVGIGGITLARSREVSCPVGYIPYNDGSNLCVSTDPVIPHKTDCPECDAAYATQTNPIHGSLGYKAQTETDFNDTSNLSFQRFYISANIRAKGMLGSHWRHTYERSLHYFNNTAGSLITVRLDRPGRGAQYFTLSGSDWVPDSGFFERLEHLGGGGWIYTDNNDTQEHYSEDGVLEIIEDKNGHVLTLQYNTDQLIAVVDERGRSLTFAYEHLSGITPTPKTRLTTLGLPDGQVVKFDYDGTTGMLVKAIYPDATPLTSADNFFREYEYGNGTNAATYQLTGLIDERTAQYASWEYASPGGKAVSSEHGVPSSGIDKVSLTYNLDGSTDVENPYSESRNYTYTDVNDVRKIDTMSDPCPACGVNFASRTYDGDGNVDVETDFEGTTTDNDYNARGLLTEKIESANHSGTKRTTEIDWDSTFRVPTERRLLNASNVLESKTTYAYNARGQVTAMCQVDPANGTAMSYTCGASANAPIGVRQTTTTYCEAGDITLGDCPILGLTTSVDGPRTDVTDITTFTYYQTDDSSCATYPTTCPYRMGDLWKVTNALSQLTEYVAYDGAGRVLQMKNADNVVTDMEYHPRGWLTARKVRGTNGASEADDVITLINYDEAGQVLKVTQPDGDYIEFTYDDAHRLTAINDAANNSITYTLDETGKRTAELTKDPSNNIKRSLSRVYDTLGRLEESKNAATTTIATLTYDANDNLDTYTDGLSRVTDQDVDPLNRLIKTIQDKGVSKINATTEFDYDARDNLITVTDPKGLDTDYTYDGLNDLTQLDSPDTGTTTYVYDDAGNRITQTDAKSVVTNYEYDELGRLAEVNYTGASGLTSTYVYDTVNGDCGGSESFAKGRLTQFTDVSGDTQYCYDRFGNMTRKRITNNSVTTTLLFSYTKAGRLETITYPSGMVATYTRNSLGQITQVAVTQGMTTTTIVNAVSYLPFGPIHSVSFPVPAGGTATTTLTQTRTYDDDYAIDSIGGLDYNVDVQGNITSIVDAGGGNVFHYDNIDRLTKVRDDTDTTDVLAFTYDETGNRLSKKIGAGGTVNNTYGGSDHHLTAVGAVSRTFDNNGNTTQSASSKYFTYDERNRLVDFRTASGGGTIVSQYQYNGKGERVRKYLGGTDQARYIYNENGELLRQQTVTGGVTTTQEIIWLEDMPIGISQNGTLHGILVDQLNSPRQVFELASQNIVWRWNMVDDPFGETMTDEDPDSNSTLFKFDMRFPGQLYDAESGLNYNYFRDYDAATGRYMQSDPIGLGGGSSTYGYSAANVLNTADPLGLSSDYGCTTIFLIPNPFGQSYAIQACTVPTWVPPREGVTHPEKWEVHDALVCPRYGSGCEHLAMSIEILVLDLRFRRWDMQRYAAINSGVYDPGHVARYLGTRGVLAELVKAAKARKCPYNQDADREIGLGPKFPTPRY